MEFNQINLTTHDHVDRRIIYALLGSAAALLAIFTIFNAINGYQAYRERVDYRTKIADLQQQATQLSAEIDKGETIDQDSAKALQERSRLANYLIALDVFPWIAVLDELEKTIPRQIVLNRFLPAADLKSIRIGGFTSSVEPISLFQDALGKTELVQSVVLENMDLGTGEEPPKSVTGNGRIQFEMICHLDLKALLPQETYGNLWMALASTTDGNLRKR